MNILLVRIGRLGDIVMILPAVKEIQRLYPKATIHVVTSPDGIRLLKAFGLNPGTMVQYKNNILSRLWELYKVRRFIRRQPFDVVYCFERKKRTLSWLPAPAKIIEPSHELQHYAWRCLTLVTASPEQDYKRHYLPVNPQKIPPLHAFLSTQGIACDTILIGLHPTYSGFNKWGKGKESRHRLWPWQHFAKLALMLADYGKKNGMDIKVVMDLLPEERRLGEQIQAASQGRAVLLPTEPDFQRYLCFLQRLNVLVVANTGVMHLAAALNTPLVALFSELHPGDCGPYMPEERFNVLRAEDTANPERGLEAIAVEAVFDAVLALLMNQSINRPGQARAVDVITG
ncbi:glycosyltransferase family 9 protein [Legionella erythra]|uniref:ADP-heptose:LPS heptosyltransferase II n=1 Tax=Legionella erythra TaxID=448 RepID=A0A0W0TV12_LEGER|nr:glycosyltransferase family 9 protein [Legionella erythra]KTC99326.1 ADP-heptose:LPS heptosyltransferase II [Legionella erythra]